MKAPFQARLLLPTALVAALLFVSGCATSALEPQQPAPQAAPAQAQQTAAQPPAQPEVRQEPSGPLAAAKARESELTDQEMERIKHSLGKDAFDQTGTAGWADLPGQGSGGLTAAHPTLPVGSKVEVTNLDNSRRIVVMITDRASFNDRVIDLSRHAAEKLGLMDTGQAQVGLRVLDRPRGKGSRTAKASIKKPAHVAHPKSVAVGVDESRVDAGDRAEVREAPAKAGKSAGTQAKASSKSAAKSGTTAKAASKGKYYVQVGAFASRSNAENLVKRLAAQGYKGTRVVPSSKGGKTLYRVQAGAFADKAQAGDALKSLKGEFPTGHLVSD